MQTIDVAVVGASAAGLFAAIHAGRTARLLGRPIRISAFDGARKLGAKILVAGGGRCNVTHWRVTEQDFSGSSAPAIRKVLGRFTELDTATFFEQLGVSLKREETGKLFPASNSARTVLNALLREAQALGVELIYPARIRRIDRHESGGFHLQGDCEPLLANRVILCTGGKALPKSGSDGEGFALACHLGHTLVEPIIPALVPLVLEDGHWITALSGLTLPAELFLKSGAGKRVVSFASSTLCTHFGIAVRAFSISAGTICDRKILIRTHNCLSTGCRVSPTRASTSFFLRPVPADPFPCFDDIFRIGSLDSLPLLPGSMIRETYHGNEEDFWQLLQPPRCCR